MLQEEDEYNMNVGRPVDRLPTSPNGNRPDLEKSKASTWSARDLSDAVLVEPAAPRSSVVSRNDSTYDDVPDSLASRPGHQLLQRWMRTSSETSETSSEFI